MEPQNQDPSNPPAPDKGKSDGNSDGNQGDANIKALQKKLTEKDVAHKAMEKELAEIKASQEKKQKEIENEKELTAQEVREMREGYKSMAQQLADMKMDEQFKEVKKDFPKYSENIIKLMIKDKKGNLEEVRTALKEQNKLLGIKSIKTPKFEKAKAKELIEQIKKDDSLSPEIKSLKITEIKGNIK